VAFAENTSFKSFGVIFWSLPPSLLLGELSMDKRDIQQWLPFHLEKYVWLAIDSTRRLVITDRSFLALWRFSILGPVRGVRGQINLLTPLNVCYYDIRSTRIHARKLAPPMPENWC
jgi:hypothetical protein